MSLLFHFYCLPTKNKEWIMHIELHWENLYGTIMRVRLFLLQGKLLIYEYTNALQHLKGKCKETKLNYKL